MFNNSRLRLLGFLIIVVPMAIWTVNVSANRCSPTNWAECRAAVWRQALNLPES